MPKYVLTPLGRQSARVSTTGSSPHIEARLVHYIRYIDRYTGTFPIYGLSRRAPGHLSRYIALGRQHTNAWTPPLNMSCTSDAARVPRAVVRVTIATY